MRYHPFTKQVQLEPAPQPSDASGATSPRDPTVPGSSLALAVLVAMVVLTPWAFGGAPAAVTRALALVSLTVGLLVVVLQVRAGGVVAPPPALWPLFGICALGAAQLVPLPTLLHQLIAPASAELWHPNDPVAAAVLGVDWKPISVHPAATWASVVWGFGLLTLTSLAIPALTEQRRRRVVVMVASAGALAVAAYGVVARVAYGPLLYGRYAVPTVSPFGPFVSKNHFAGYVGMATLMTLGLAVALADRERSSGARLSWISGRHAGRVVVAFGAATVLALAVLVSQSRGGALALLAGVVSFVMLRQENRPTRKLQLLSVALAVGIAGGLWVVLPSDARQRLTGLVGRPDSSGEYRLGLWRDTFHAFVQSPWLGQGLGAFEDAIPRLKTVAAELRVEHAENDYLELLAEGGALAGVLAVTALVISVRRLLSERRRGSALPIAGSVAGAIAGLATLLVHSLFDFNLRLPASALLAAFLFAIVVAWPGGRLRRLNQFWGMSAGLALTGVLLGEAHRRDTLTAVSGGVGSETVGPIRRRLADRNLTRHLHSRPGDAEAWAHLAWFRALAGQIQEGAALAQHAARLDPQRSAFLRYADQLRAHP